MMARRMKHYRQINIDGDVWWWKYGRHPDHWQSVIIYDPSITKKYIASPKEIDRNSNYLNRKGFGAVQPIHVEKYIREEILKCC